ncbi:DUF397 domain-containing protein [Streptomyces sp. NPDC005322]|uniref:DUF397 domain-containing protein n=1 Tax=Streptomyces sp. NPDC005322 TaxID=3157032 RepID=UPI0033BBBB5F
MESTPDLTAALWRKSSYSGSDGGECVECATLGGATWRKSSYSSDIGNECVECAALGGAVWRKSSHSGDDGGECVEVAAIPTQQVAIRDSKNPHGPTLLLSPAAFADFVAATASGKL